MFYYLFQHYKTKCGIWREHWLRRQEIYVFMLAMSILSVVNTSLGLIPPLFINLFSKYLLYLTTTVTQALCYKKRRLSQMISKVVFSLWNSKTKVLDLPLSYVYNWFLLFFSYFHHLRSGPYYLLYELLQ